MIASVPRRRRSPLHDGSLYQPRRPAFWVYVVIIVVTGIVSFGQQSFFRQISPAGWALSWALLAVYALPVLFLVYVLDLYEREPLSLVIGALLWGAIAATTLSGFANDGWGLVVSRVGGPEFAARWTAALTAPFVEEILKGLGVVLIYLIAPDEFDDMMDGFVYGAVCGLGFAVVEDVFYFMGVFGGHPNGVLAGVLRPRGVERALFARPVHRTRRDGHRVLRVPAHPSSARAADHGARGPVGRRRARTLPVELALARSVPLAAVERRGSGHDPGRDGGERTPAARVRDARGRVGPQTRAHVAARRARRRDRRPRHLRGPSSRRSRTRACGAGRSAACGRAPGATPPGSSAASSENR